MHFTQVVSANQHFMKLTLSILTISFVVISFNSRGQATVKYTNLLEEQLSPSEMHEDIDALTAVLNEAHPLLNYFISENEWKNLIKDTKQSINDSLTHFQFYRRIAPIIASIHEGHTYIEPSRDLTKAHQEFKRILPFKTILVENHLHIDSSYVDAGHFPRGTELISINGESIQGIVEKIESSASFKTGTDNNFVESILNGGFNFAMAYSYFIGDNNTFTITYRLPSTYELFNAELIGIYNPEPNKTFPHWGKIEKPFLFKYMSDSTAYMKVRGWLKYKPLNISERDIKRFFHNSFSEINAKGINNLVIDLRDNGGGSPRLATEMLRYLIPVTFRPIEYTQLKTQKLTTISELRNTKNSRINKSSLKCENKNLVVRHLGIYKKHRPRKNLFKGNVYFLVNSKCGSATSLFLALAEYYHIGEFIGETPGGNKEFVCGHQLLTFELPNAQLAAQVPLKKSKINTTNESSRDAVSIDYDVPYNLNDIFSSYDTQLNFVLNLIANENSANK